MLLFVSSPPPPSALVSTHTTNLCVIVLRASADRCVKMGSLFIYFSLLWFHVYYQVVIAYVCNHYLDLCIHLTFIAGTYWIWEHLVSSWDSSFRLRWLSLLLFCCWAVGFGNVVDIVTFSLSVSCSIRSAFSVRTAFDQLQYLNVSIANESIQSLHAMHAKTAELTLNIVNSDNGFIGSRNTSLSKSLDITTELFCFVLFCFRILFVGFVSILLKLKL